MISITVVLIVAIAIWHFSIYLSDLSEMEEYSWINHFLIAVTTTLLTFILIKTALRVDNVSWKRLGQASIKTNLFSFLLGFFLWVIPAAIGLFICLTLGWVELTVNTNLNELLLNILILSVTVFLIEALPEEFIFRGYIYSYLNVLFPHWATLFLQTILFSLFAFFIGAMYSVEQLQFIPGFALILGYFRAVSGNVWTSIGFHVAIMTATQILNASQNHFDVSGLFTLQFFAFILLPSAIGATVLSFVYPKHNWIKIN